MDRITSNDDRAYRQQTEQQNFNRGAVSERSLYEELYTPQEFSHRNNSSRYSGGLSGGLSGSLSGAAERGLPENGIKQIAPCRIHIDGSIEFQPRPNEIQKSKPQDMQPRAGAQEANPNEKPRNMQTSPRAHEQQPDNKPRSQERKPGVGQEAVKDPGFLYPLFPNKDFCGSDRSELPMPKLPHPMPPQESPKREADRPKMSQPDMRKEMPLRQGASW